MLLHGMCSQDLFGVAVHCSALQCVAVHCSALQCAGSPAPDSMTSLKKCSVIYTKFKLVNKLQSLANCNALHRAAIHVGQETQRTAWHCNILQHTATHCNALQHTATHCDALRCTATHCNALQHTATHCNALQRTATHCNALQHTATHCNALHHSASLCNTLQSTASHCNALTITAAQLRHTATHLQTTMVSQSIDTACFSVTAQFLKTCFNGYRVTVNYI